MIWGGISIVFGKMLFIKKEKYAINAQVYIRDILQGYIEPLDGDYTFVQDGATAHTARQTMEYCRENGIDVKTQSPKSPDLNPIEVIWANLKRKVEKRRPDSKARLIAAIQESWDEISFEEVQNSILKVKNERAKQVIEAQGEWS
ncbi:unnamed protein product [Blepharisma stoltei]|uniref:Tc1-like transposase DDE domain-containing protein n=1 Tax=Blepharisma stoltei TaxID=1481888 RepID=A0AAU9K5P3_9CILI|nr:unnamed protein product [Blepharisma stoltei]